MFLVFCVRMGKVLEHVFDHHHRTGVLDRHYGELGFAGKAAPGGLLAGIVALFALAIAINYGASLVQERVTGQMAENVLFDIRRRMFGHLQRVSLSFMDKTEVGRLMSRLQGDVNSMQEFLETSVQSLGDVALLIGIVAVMLWLDWQLAGLVLLVLPVLLGVRVLWLAKARAAFMAAHEALIKVAEKRYAAVADRQQKKVRKKLYKQFHKRLKAENQKQG